eukprot:sb/3476820/
MAANKSGERPCKCHMSPSLEMRSEQDKLRRNLSVEMILPEKNKIWSRNRAMFITISTLLHMFALALSYMLMLIAMTFNVWLFLAVILGAGTGKLILLLKTNIVPVGVGHCNEP